LDRRDFLLQTGTLLAGATLTRDALAMVAEAPLGAAQQGRLVLPINRNWRFSPKVVEGAHTREFDDSGFERVVVPHTNRRLPWHSFDDKSYEFVSLYRRHFKLPAEARGRRVFVDFEG
jgi:beta-galactosidase